MRSSQVVAGLGRRQPRVLRFHAWFVVGAVVALVLLTHWWGNRLLETGHNIKLGVPPLHAVWDPRFGADTVLVGAFGVLLVAWVPHWSRTWTWSRLPAMAFSVTLAWTTAINATRGWRGFTQGLDNRHEYLRDVPHVTSPLSFLDGFTAQFDTFTTHTQGHPPLFVLTLWVLRAAGLGGAGSAAVLCIVAGALATSAVLLAVRDVAGEVVARRALPFVAAAPTALWIGSSADAFYAGLGAAGIALVVRAATAPGRSGLAFIGGATLGFAMLGSYGLTLLLVVAAPTVLVAANARLLGGSVLAGSAFVLATAFVLGFNYMDGFRLTREAYFRGVASERPVVYALVANVAALVIALGPATVAGMTRLRGRLWLLTGGAMAAVVLAQTSGLSRLEVERIWLPFAVWLLPAGAALSPAGSRWMARPWLALQIGSALLVQTVVRTGW